MELTTDALPQGFDFYHLGRIELLADERAAALETRELEGRFAVAFAIEGEARGALLLLVDEGLDASVYSEAGNIIASRLVSSLSQSRGLELTVSPPQRLSGAQLAQLLRLAGGRAAVRDYVHRHGAQAILMTAVLLPSSDLTLKGVDGQSPTSPEATGNA